MKTRVGAWTMVALLLLFLSGCPALFAEDQDQVECDPVEIPVGPDATAEQGYCEECETTAADPVFIQQDFRAMVPHRRTSSGASDSGIEEVAPTQLLERFQAVEETQVNTVPHFLAEARLQLLLGDVEKSVKAERQAARLSFEKSPSESLQMLRDSMRTMADHGMLEMATKLAKNDLDDARFRSFASGEVLAIAAKADSLYGARCLLDIYTEALGRASKAECNSCYPAPSECRDLLLLALHANQLEVGVGLVQKAVHSRSANCGDIDALIVVAEYLVIMGRPREAKDAIREADQALRVLETSPVTTQDPSVSNLRRRMSAIQKNGIGR